MPFAASAGVLVPCGRREDTTYDQRTRPSGSESIAGLESHRRRCCATPRVGGAGDRLQPGSSGNWRSRKRRRAAPRPACRRSGAQGCRSTSGGHLPARWRMGVRQPNLPSQLGMQFAEAGYLTIVLDYRLAPEHPFPAALEDTMFAIGWAADNARRWNGDGRRIAIGGDSAGGNLAVSAITSSAPKLRSLVRAAVLFYGAYDLEATAERTKSLPGLQEQLSTYVSGKRDLFDDPRVSPLRAVAPGILPPCFIVGAGDDSWCLADSLALAQALSAVASPYELHVMEGIPHGFMQMSTLDGCR